MKTYLYEKDGTLFEYRDGKRWLWSLSVLYPLSPLLGIAAHQQTGWTWTLALALILSYGLGPIVDAWIGEDPNNPPREAVGALESDGYYRWLTLITVPLHFVSLIGAVWYAAIADLSVAAYVVLALTTGLASGLAINTAHELGHKSTRTEQWLARAALAVPAYGHFCVEHNRGHHRDVATPEDPASARMGESIYRFALREIPGAWRRGIESERDRLTKLGLSFWSLRNVILQSYAITLVLQLGLLVVFGMAMLPFLLIHNVFAWWQLTSANYVEHYGLKRRRIANGRYEPCRPCHSWNSNYLASNLLLFHLQRHSEHHANPRRRYQALASDPDAPRLPSGYFGMYLAAYVPPIWYALMDSRLLALPHIDGDLDAVNVDPASHERLLREYAGLLR
ncbi:MAG: alkane 1-monooxygenase [Pseudomonadota bacterium]